VNKILIGTALAALAGLAAVALTTFPAGAEEPHAHGSSAASSHGRWSPEAIDVFARLPVQDGGRVKPLSTFAGFALLGLNGRRDVGTPSGARLEPTEWLMDCLFFPEEATHYECFLVQDAEALDALGIAHEGKSRRARYTYMDLAPARAKLFELAQQYNEIDEKQRNPVQGQVLNLAHNVMQFETIASLLGPIVRGPAAADSPGLTKVFGATSHPGLADVLGHASDLKPFLGGGDDPHGAPGAAASDEALRGWIDDVVSGSRGVALIPPPGTAKERAEWMSPSDVTEGVLFRGEALTPQVAALAELEAMVAARDDGYTFRTHAETFRDRVVALAESRGEYGKIPLEVTFYKADFFYNALYAFVAAFLCVAFSWVKPAKILTRGAASAIGVGTLLLVAGITMRCIIRDRPPVSTLYETVLFVTAVAVIGAMVTEYVNRQGIALALATVLGTGGLFLANKYELQEHVDTMPSLVAVLDTNFWLATHVTCVTIGYGAGLLAGAIGHVYVLGKVFGLKRNDTGFYKTLNSMTYGMLCFGLLFSVVGTVLGGIWANESWGRFWGWDPKENGALTIVLWELIVLHARMGGYLRDFGVAMASVFGTAVVASSWWGVNLLGVGLHSYGFTSGILIALLVFYGIEALVLAAGGIHWSLRGNAAPASASSGPPPIPPGSDVLEGGVR
jgi:ABC-type transport system involved in cytochrome c biogenesis permease subunit